MEAYFRAAILSAFFVPKSFSQPSKNKHFFLAC
ncbi:hypothetical protein BACCIP111899_04000 [Bacillus rhizoplanae]|uniref:Uncharacterized protein n=1 Tax=Bacillus rhizoplanae TaxID=2880966 RepID=A0ABM8YFZ9_9BACI|nr:hypothetical protein BACCIP111899_04000 [Bacillus rhizoplanae]